MKKVLIGLFALASVSAFANEGINVYGKVGLDFASKFTEIKEDGDTIFSKKGKTGANFALEVTKDITSNFELGAGIAYTYRKDSKNDYIKMEGPKKYNYKNDIPRYESFPLYLTTKYNFNINSEITPYIKADLGYSLNKDIKVNFNDINLTDNTKDKGSLKLKVKNGLYAAFGVGAEYNNFVADLSYVHTKAKVTSKYSNETYKYNNSAVRLSVGYKFNF